MADIKTHLRELSVAVTIGLLNEHVDFKRSDLYNGKTFLSYAKNIMCNDISNADNIAKYDNFSAELKEIVDNGYKLGKKIYEHPDFQFGDNLWIEWVGNDTQKDDPTDIMVGDYSFSLKENSYILENMGLYKLLNTLTGSNYARGLHIFSTFAPIQYEAWFSYTWHRLCAYIEKFQHWSNDEGRGYSEIRQSENNIIMNYEDETSVLPKNLSSTSSYMKLTSSHTREKAFSKWINQTLSKDEGYINIKRECSEAAGQKVSDIINRNYSPKNVYRFFHIYQNPYFYAKTTADETTILYVPGISEFEDIIEFCGCRHSVSKSQLDIISTFRNTKTGRILEFQNQCRFSHGQFNGTPEAKQYVTRNSSLTDLYTPLR